jgi:hypothetical protein
VLRNDAAWAIDNLNKIAEGGGTTKAYLLDGSSSALADFAAALTSIRGKAQSCHYQLPSRTDLDYGRVNVNVTIGGTSTLNALGQARWSGAMRRR